MDGPMQHWVMRLCGLYYTIEHIPGEENAWADIVSRWHARDVVNAQSPNYPYGVPFSPPALADDGFIFPTRDEIIEGQQTASQEEDGVVTISNRVWILIGAKDLLARIFVVPHCGSQGHRGQEPMIFALKERFYVLKMKGKVVKFSKHFKGLVKFPARTDRFSRRRLNGTKLFTGVFYRLEKDLATRLTSWW
ncbi:LOW QUALITY PROTEIN: hypothetical protein PHMEG_0008775 [Phytophthora megakarya]|uniref:Reverse transcriptase RNase H-like domain-containing protein n=1 Tax=Phytophthora megakarya TaxID=4795 RepID=A0A225WIA8_9STRA|nr:LOW QUALITY PROTEIN: hypothetical protein PHMEG_0008775 [Phytophthora megakarya]